MTDQSHIRNFCIIAHIDHGKSTLADRLLEITGTVQQRDMKAQLLDQMELEREKGITIKLQPVRMEHNDYQLNLIDTPGHVDFNYEVSRSLEACEGAILVVDASQGIQAQTLANVYLALAADLTIIPVLNKIDLPAADVPRVSAEVVSLLGCNESDILKVSAKTGEGVPEVIDAVIDRVSPPRGSAEAPARALVFDSFYDEYRGVILYVRVVDGEIKKGAEIRPMASQADGLALEVGALRPKSESMGSLYAGEIGYIVTNYRSTREARVGDTVTLASLSADAPLPGYQEAKPFVYAGVFPASADDYRQLQDALEKLSLSDSALKYEKENSQVLGFGFRVGFLGLLHMEIIKERLQREYGIELIITNPSTDYKVKTTTGEEMIIKSAADLPDAARVASISEPWIKGEIACPKDYVGAAVQLIVSARGYQTHIDYIEGGLATVSFEAPLANMLTDFYDNLKSNTSGYGSFSYDLADYREDSLVRVDFYVAGESVDALSVIVHRSEADRLGRSIVKKLKDVIPRQNFQVALQAAIGGRFIARETLSAYRKDVTTGLYGGDVSRKKKVLAKQKKGKARMKRFGKVDIPSEAFTVMLKRDD